MPFSYAALAETLILLDSQRLCTTSTLVHYNPSECRFTSLVVFDLSVGKDVCHVFAESQEPP
jgi:hypothetical protein